MALRASKAQFETRQFKRGGSWYVLVTWASGSSAKVNDFASGTEADEWIKNKSAAWLKARATGSHD